MPRRKTIKELDAEVKGLRQELLRLKDAVAAIKKAVWTKTYKPQPQKCPCCGTVKVKNPYDDYRYFTEE
tara:strand:- start:5511 stop:5717 length:207 start_codon:yes stop_codon:yes gene_type:complete